MSQPRQIDQRPMPMVKGIDLEHALNYVCLQDVSAEFIDQHYTARRLPYTRGSRPVLEALAAKITHGLTDELAIVNALTAFVANQVKWAGFYRKQYNQRLPSDRGLDEESLIASQFAWCNEQARILCCLTQLASLPSRLVFASNASQTYGHVVTEVLTAQGWLLVDQSFGFLFVRERQVTSAEQLVRNPANRAYFAPIYAELCAQLAMTLSPAILADDFAMAVAPSPLTGFERLGFHNYYIH